MNVKQLREYLKDFHDELPVILSKDGEGNGFSPLSSANRGMYTPESTYSGEWTDEEVIGYDDYTQPGPAAVYAVCLWPVN